MTCTNWFWKLEGHKAMSAFYLQQPKKSIALICGRESLLLSNLEVITKFLKTFPGNDISLQSRSKLKQSTESISSYRMQLDSI